MPVNIHKQIKSVLQRIKLKYNCKTRDLTGGYRQAVTANLELTVRALEAALAQQMLE